MKKFIALAAVAGAALVASSQASAYTWTTVARDYDRGRYGTATDLTRHVQRGTFRVRVKSPKGPTRVRAYLLNCYYEDHTEEARYTWRYRSLGYYRPWWKQRIPETYTTASDCVVHVFAWGVAGRMALHLQRRAAS